MLILFLCRQGDLVREALGYLRAFERRGIHVAHVEDSFPLDGGLQSLLAHCPEKPALILHPETPHSFLPRDLAETDIPTACYHYDVYAYTHRRVRWAMLFDYVFVFHPGYEARFGHGGHPRVFVQPHAVEPGPFLCHSGHTRTHDVGWVGKLAGSFYSRRRRTIPRLADKFRMNDWRRTYTYEEMAEVYGHSNIGLNIARDDYPQDANLRVFEIMASGALLITSMPSELENIGFQCGTHFVGYHEERELPDCVGYYLHHDTDRKRIANAGRELVLREHTYDRRVEAMLRILDQDGGELFAPARSWPKARRTEVYIDYYCAHDLLDSAFEEFGGLAIRRPAVACKAVVPILGAVRRRLKNQATHVYHKFVHK